MSYKTPGVYVEEIVKFPPSVAQVETAIPAFIGYTEIAKKKIEDDLIMQPIRITSMLEYEIYFGGADKETNIDVKITDTLIGGVQSREVLVTEPLTPSPYKMYYSMQMFFANGGGPCYIISVGSYSNTVALGKVDEDLVGGLTELEKLDEPTLIVFPDATSLAGESDFYSLYEAALLQCNKLQDRFTIIDTYTSETIEADALGLRGGIGLGKDYLKYGAAYYPHLNTILDYQYDEDSITIEHINDDTPNAISEASSQLESYQTDIRTEGTLLNEVTDGYIVLAKASTLSTISEVEEFVNITENITASLNNFTTIRALIDSSTKSAIASIEEAPDGTLATNIESELETVKLSFNSLDTINKTIQEAIDTINKSKTLTKKQAQVTIIKTELLNITDATLASPVDLVEDFAVTLDALITAVESGSSIDLNNAELNGRSLKSIETSNSQLYNQIKSEIGLLPVVLPPSSTMAGIYARVDGTRGVWKAPANVGVTYVLEPSVYISHEAQQNLNVDVTAGKSINAIRTFVGKGNLVWGARTLAGNDNEWRYVPVRRFFNMAEESIKKATEQFVFEPNDKNTWVSLKGMIGSFLNGQWRAGALAGTTPDQAFYVNIGLGETMTAQDILEGSMIVEIGMAVVRPAEFIVLKFSHKMQEV